MRLRRLLNLSLRFLRGKGSEMADNDDEENTVQAKQPQVVINTGQPPAPNYAGLFNAAGQAPKSPTVVGPTAPIPQGQSANQASPEDLSALQQNLAGQAPSQAVPDQNINLGLNRVQNPHQGNVQPADFQQAQNDYLSQMQKNTEANVDAIRAQERATLAQASVMGQQGLEENKLYQESSQKLNDLTTDFNQRFKSHQEELHNTLKDLNDGHINPEQFHENQSVPQKIATAIGLLMGGISAGLLRQENPVIKWMNQQVDRDIEAQKSNINSAYNHYREQMQDSMQAENMTRAILQQNYADKIRATASKYVAPSVQQQAAQVVAGLESNVHNLLGQTAMEQSKKRMQSSMMDGQQNIAPEQQALYLSQMGAIPQHHLEKILNEIGTAKEQAALRNQLLNAFQESAKEQTLTGAIGRGGAESRAAGSLKNIAMEMIKKKYGRVTPAEIETFESAYIPRIREGEESTRERMQNMIHWANSMSETPTADAYRIKIPEKSMDVRTNFVPYGK